MKSRIVAQAVLIAATFAWGARANAMPVFAEAYGFDCQKCHIEVPALNSYGRYVQRSMYAVLDRKTLATIPPFWLGEAVFADSADANEPHKLQFGNLAIHTSGFIADDLTTHIQQWLVSNDKPGGLDTAWISYNHIFGKNTHLVVGKMPPPGPSYFSQWMDLAPFAAPQITIGEHAESLASNRWGAKAGYADNDVAADVGWYGSSADLDGATDFSRAVDKTVQWHVAYAPIDRPFQVGLYGDRGSLPLALGGVDHYSASGVYAQADQTHRAPGVLLSYQRTWDDRSASTLGRAAGNAATAELFWKPLRHYEALLSAREEVTSGGFGMLTRSANIDVNLRLARFVHATAERYFQTGAAPGVRYQIWWTTPVERVH